MNKCKTLVLAAAWAALSSSAAFSIDTTKNRRQPAGSDAFACRDKPDQSWSAADGFVLGADGVLKDRNGAVVGTNCHSGADASPMPRTLQDCVAAAQRTLSNRAFNHCRPLLEGTVDNPPESITSAVGRAREDLRNAAQVCKSSWPDFASYAFAPLGGGYEYSTACKSYFSRVGELRTTADQEKDNLRTRCAAGTAGGADPGACQALKDEDVANRLNALPGKNELERLQEGLKRCNAMQRVEREGPQHKDFCEHVARAVQQDKDKREREELDSALNRRCRAPASGAQTPDAAQAREAKDIWCTLQKRRNGDYRVMDEDERRRHLELAERECRALGAINHRDARTICDFAQSLRQTDAQEVTRERQVQTQRDTQRYIDCLKTGRLNCERPQDAKENEIDGTACRMANYQTGVMRGGQCVATGPAAPAAPAAGCGGAGQRMCYRPTNGQPAGCGNGLLPFGRGDVCSEVNEQTCRRVAVFAWNGATGKCQWRPRCSGRWDEASGRCVRGSVPPPR